MIENYSETITAQVIVSKDTETFGGPNMWYVAVGPVTQWVGVYDAEKVVGHALPRYSEEPAKVRKVS